MSLRTQAFLKIAALGAACLLIGATMVTVTGQILTLEQERTLGPALVSLLASPNETTAARAALAIGRTKRPAGARLLEAHLSDPRAAVRAMSVYGLGVIALGSDAPALAGLAKRDVSSAVRLAAFDALGRYEAAQKLPRADEATAEASMAGALSREPDTTVRGRAAIALNAFADGPRGPAAALALETAMRTEKSDYVRERIMWTVFRRYAPKVPLAFLREHLRDSNEIVRIEVARAYGHLKGSKLVADLRPLLGDPSWRVQEQAAESIRVLVGEKLHDHWTRIPATVHTPAPVADALASLQPIDASRDAKPHKPQVADAGFAPAIDPATASDMVGPAHGPHPRVRIVTTQGNVYAVLYPEWAPMTTLNFLNLARNGFYSNNPWFRIVPDFVVQTGEQDAKKAPGPGYTIAAEENPMEQNSYVLSMGLDYNAKTNTPIRDSAGSEYYITLSPQYHLDNDFSVFGSVTSGTDVLGRLVESDKVIRIERLPDVNL